MLTFRSNIRNDRGSARGILEEDLETRLLLGVVQIALATLFVPAWTLILIVVGLYMIAEWAALRAAAAIRFVGRHRAASPFHRGTTRCATPIR